jgi:hypothetical protein
MTSHTTFAESNVFPSLENARSIAWPTLEKQVRVPQRNLAQVCLYDPSLTDTDIAYGGESKLIHNTLAMAAAVGLGIEVTAVNRSW